MLLLILFACPCESQNSRVERDINLLRFYLCHWQMRKPWYVGLRGLCGMACPLTRRSSQYQNLDLVAQRQGPIWPVSHGQISVLPWGGRLVRKAKKPSRHLFLTYFLEMLGGVNDLLIYTYVSFIFFLKRFYLFIFRERGREGERARCVRKTSMPRTRDLARNSGMCPDQEWNQWSFALQDDIQATEPHW